jgi:hypothetical protein
MANSNLNTNFDTKSLKKITSVAGIVSVVIIMFYATGLYRNYLEIQKLKGKDPAKK